MLPRAGGRREPTQNRRTPRRIRGRRRPNRWHRWRSGSERGVKWFGTFRLQLPLSPCRRRAQEAAMRSRTSVIIVTLALLAIPVFAGPAFAGGSWLAPERSAYVPAEIAVFQGDFGSGSLE